MYKQMHVEGYNKVDGGYIDRDDESPAKNPAN